MTRVRDEFFDQSERAGHDHRDDDLERFAALGVKRLRYPVLWETGVTDRSVAAVRRLRDLGIDPIVGLLHHGSGPASTALTAEDFAPGLARHAADVARQMPWVTHWTPVNEPLTTARFSLLYGHWYPHVRDERAFWLGLLNQIDAVRLAMRAIREINPAALLVQTEDIGKTWATPPVQPQADFDNLRRWMTWDLLLGRVTAGHELYDRLLAFGFAQRLETIAADPSPPDIIGLDHYLTSDRFLDHRLDRYPQHTHGGSALGRYADVEAVRVLDPPVDGCLGAVVEAWERYRLPLALTEIHNGCTREEQMRWLADAWTTAVRCRQDGIDIRAVTAWSLLGAYDWNSLMTCRAGTYESGAFDVRGPKPRRTALGHLTRALATSGEITHPALDRGGWWQQPARLIYGSTSPDDAVPLVRSRTSQRRLLIVGATGTLGRALAMACEKRNLDYFLADRECCPLDQEVAVAALLDALRPWAVINAAGWVRVDDAERDPDSCFAVNTEGSVRLAALCGRRDIPLVTFSSDLVFDGQAGRDYFEDDVVAPLNIYGHSKARADGAILDAGVSALVVRTAAFFSADDAHNFAAQLHASLRAGTPFQAANDLIVSPTYVPDLVDTVLDLVIDGETGLWHLTNKGALTWAAFAAQLADVAGLDASLIDARPVASLGWRATRPKRVSLSSSRGLLLPRLDNAVERFTHATREKTMCELGPPPARSPSVSAPELQRAD